MNEFEYYIVERDGSQAYPLLATDSDYPHTMMYIRTEELINDPQLTGFKYSDPIPRNPVIGDYFSQTESVVSKKIKDVLEPLNIKGIQLIPAQITTNKGDVLENYYYIHIANYIMAVDREHSVYTPDDYDEDILSLDNFKLNESVLNEIELIDRLIFRLKESKSTKIYHKSIVDAIMAVNPTGLKFRKVEDWRY